jgi:hypothetical protein
MHVNLIEMTLYAALLRIHFHRHITTLRDSATHAGLVTFRQDHAHSVTYIVTVTRLNPLPSPDPVPRSVHQL